MIDIHCHIIHGVDDGPSNIAESLKMIREAERLGISQIMATPHYQECIFGLERVEENYQELLFRAQDYDVTINLGFEVFADPNNHSYFKYRKKLSLNKSGVILLEFPFNTTPLKCVDMVRKYRAQKITPVIAHLERNRSFINRFDIFVTFIKAGCYIQLDAASIAGVYGLKIKEFSRRLIQMKLADMISSNAHCAKDYLDWYSEAYKNVSNWVGKEEAGILFHNNAKQLLDGRNSDELANRNILVWERMV